MGAEDYLRSLQATVQQEVPLERLGETHWAPELVKRMRERGVAAYEESLLPLLLEDLATGRPPVDCGRL
jgi:hypothetical protein